MMTSEELKKDGTFREIEWAEGKVREKLEGLGWNTETGPQGRYQKIDKRLLHIDEAYQRARVDTNAERMAKSFNWAAFGPLIVSNRNEHEYFVIDGGHRAYAAMFRPDICTVPCYVIEGLTREQEAEAFVKINKHRRPPTGVDVFRAQLVMEDPLALEVQAVLDKHGIEVVQVRRHHRNRLQAVQNALRLQYRGMLEDVLVFILSTWPEDDERLLKCVFVGVELLRQSLENSLGLPLESAEVLGFYRGTNLTALRQDGMRIRDNIRCSYGYGVGEALKGRWNKAHRTRKLNGTKRQEK